MLFDRLLILVAFVALIGLAMLVARWWVSARDRERQRTTADQLWDVLGAHPDGRTTVVAFSTPACAVCKSAQSPALRALVDQLGPTAIRLIQVNAAEQPRVAEAFGVLTVPTTVVLAPAGQVTTTNNGFAPLNRLTQQVQQAASA